MDKAKRMPGLVIMAILIVVMAVFDVILLRTKMLPIKFLIPLCGLVLVLVVIATLLVLNSERRGRFTVGLAVSILLAAGMIFGSYAIARGIGKLADLTTTTVELTEVCVYVRADDPAESLQDASGYTFGIIRELNRKDTDKTIEQINEELGIEIQTAEYSTSIDLVDALLSEETGAMILNEAYLDVLEEMEDYAELSSQIRELKRIVVETEIQKPVAETKTTESFTVYIAGIDSRNGLIAKSRNDVNIIATVNPQTRQILLVSTPRDYFVPLSISNGVRDKLTHAGIYGIDVAVDTMEMLYDIDIDYYFRLNFSGFVDIINTLGGVTVHSDYAFTAGGYSYVEGDNYLNGEQALSFVRERKSFAEGDRQRGRDQLAVIQALAKKMCSTAILTNYTSLLDELDGSFETSVPYDVIAALVSNQLADNSEWNIVSYSADGEADWSTTYSMNRTLWVMQPDYDTVETAKQLMEQVRNGEIVTIPD